MAGAASPLGAAKAAISALRTDLEASKSEALAAAEKEHNEAMEKMRAEKEAEIEALKAQLPGQAWPQARALVPARGLLQRVLASLWPPEHFHHRSSAECTPPCGSTWDDLRAGNPRRWGGRNERGCPP